MHLRSALMMGLLLIPSGAWARSFRVSQVPNTFNSCGTCHVNPAGGGTRNAFGMAVEASLVGGNVAWSSVCNLDSDRDGFTNGEELGDPNCSWSIGSPNPPGTVTNPGDSRSFPSTPDAGVADTGAPDLGPPDSGRPDTGPVDQGVPDTGVRDAGARDMGVGTPDVGGPDLGMPDTGPRDTGTRDAGPLDAGRDAGARDAEAPDLAIPDLGPPDASAPDTGPRPDAAGMDAAAAGPDASGADAADGGAPGSVTPSEDDEGCTCSTRPRDGWAVAALLPALGLLLLRRRPRASARSRGGA